VLSAVGDRSAKQVPREHAIGEQAASDDAADGNGECEQRKPRALVGGYVRRLGVAMLNQASPP
jgi:hypothetical protein